MVSKDYKREFKKKVTKVLQFYHRSSFLFHKDKASREIARQGDVLAAEIFALINDRVGKTAEGQIAAIIAIIQSYAFIRRGMAHVEEDPGKLMDAFTKLFMRDHWRWIKHDHVQIYYDMFFMGLRGDSKEFLDCVNRLHSYDKKNYK